MKQKKYHGVVVPMVTPLSENYTLDEHAVVRLIEHLTRNGTTPFLLGTTGEGISLSPATKFRLVDLVCKTVAGRTPVYAGISNNNLETTIESARRCFDAGVEVVVAHLPNYFPLTPGQILRYFELLVDKVSGPLIIYNIKSTVHMSIPLELIDQLSQHPQIVGLKDSERELQRLERGISMWKDRMDFSYFIGWGAQMGHGLLLGADGIVPSTGNILPELYTHLYEAAMAGDTQTVENLQQQADAIGKIYQKDRTLGESLAALKVIMNELDLCEPHVLPPLTRLPEENERKLKKMADDMNLRGTFSPVQRSL